MTEDNDFKIYNATRGLIDPGGGMGMMMPPQEPQFQSASHGDMPSVESRSQSDKTLEEILSALQTIISQMRNI